MIHCVRVKGYKSLRDEVEVRLQPLTILFGPNAAGKSNLFDALHLLSRMVTQRTLREAFEGHRGTPLEAFSYGEGGVEGLLARPTAQFSLEVDVELSESAVRAVERRIEEMRQGLPERETNPVPAKHRVVDRLLRYAVTVEITTDSGYLRVVDERLAALNRDRTERKSRRPFVERVGDRLHLRLEGQAHPTFHEVGLDHTLLSTPLYEPHYPHLAAFKEELSRWRFYYLEPHSMRADAPLREVYTLGPLGSDLAPFFNTLKAHHPRQFEAVNRALRLLLPSAERLDVEPTRGGLLQLELTENGTPFSARVISEGTLRLLGLLAILSPLSPTTVIGYEEPENGVHPRRLKLIADLLHQATDGGQRQVLVNTHSPVFPEYFDEASLVVCRKEQGATIFTPFESWGGLFRRQAIEAGLAGEEGETPLSQRILRGDFDG